MLVGLALLFNVVFASPAQLAPAPSYFAAPAHCSTSFFGIPTWYKYLPDNNFDSDCTINKNFQLLGNGSNSGLLLIVLALVDILLRVAALVAVAFVIIGGFKYMTAQGEPAGVKSATQTLVGALVGLVIAIIATAVVSFIGNRLG